MAEETPNPKVAWTEVRVNVALGWHELVAEALTFGPCSTVVFGTTSIAAEQPAEGLEAVRGFALTGDDTPAFRSEVAARLTRLGERVGVPELEGLAPRFKALPPEDYATSWRKDWRPFRVGRLTLLPPWRAEPPPRPTDVRLTIEPGGSFGSGRHATTRTCLRILDREIRGGESVLDAGAGSGVLSVAAARLGAARTLGFDIDPASHVSARELAEDNGVGDRCTFRMGDFSAVEPGEGPFDVVLANIYADVLQAEARSLASLLSPGGWFCFSGCRVDHRDATVPALEGAGLEVREERRRGRWVTFFGGPK